MSKMLDSGEIPQRIPQNALDEAQDVMYSAREESNSQRRIRLAKRALEISPDCADAYVLLAEEWARSWDESEELFRKGVEAGERVLGPEAFEQDAGHFWGILETRPYMRARLGLATVLGLKGELDEAISHRKELTRLNPQDHLGIRGVLAGYLFREDRDEELADLLEQFEDDLSPEILYTRALSLFRKRDECEDTNDALNRAFEMNSHVPGFLLGKRKIPKELPEYVKLGGPEQAAAYAKEALRDRRSTQGALFWLERQTSRKKPQH